MYAYILFTFFRVLWEMQLTYYHLHFSTTKSSKDTDHEEEKWWYLQHLIDFQLIRRKKRQCCGCVSGRI